jgi:hypothetical protein
MTAAAVVQQQQQPRRDPLGDWNPMSTCPRNRTVLLLATGWRTVVVAAKYSAGHGTFLNETFNPMNAEEIPSPVGWREAPAVPQTYQGD